MSVAPVSETVITFRIGRQRYALPLESVELVVRLPDLAAIAGAPPALAGMLNLRGAFLPVLDGSALMGEPAGHTLDSSILVIALRGAPALGLLVDKASAVDRIAADRVSALTNGAPFVRAILGGAHTTILLDPDALGAVAGV